MAQIQERRKFIRIPAKYSLTVKRMTMSSRSMEEDIAMALKNLSTSGALFETPKLFQIGDVLLLKMSIPGWEKYKTDFIRPGQLSRSEPLTALATVVRVEFIKSGHHEVGVCFVGIDEGHQRALKALITKASGAK
jgi:c-di-GMP-binding flagellar brake protein YcgR